MTSKLSCHWQRTHEGQQDYGYLSRWRPLNIKIITIADNDVPGLDTALKYLRDGGQVIVRHHPLSENWGARGFTSRAQAQQMGRDHAAYLGKLWNIIRTRYQVAPEQLLWCGINEPNVWGSEPPELTAAYYGELMRRMHVMGLLVLALSFGVGWPGNGGVTDAPPIWAPYEEVRQEMHDGDALGLHEYWAACGPQYAFRWLAGRFLQCPWRCKIIVGECGIDDAVAPGAQLPSPAAAPAWTPESYAIWMAMHPKRLFMPDGEVGAAALDHFGWRGLNPNAEVAAGTYLAQLRWYDAELAKDERVQSAMMFTYDFSQPWATFDVRCDEFMNPMLAYIAAAGGTSGPQAPVINPPVPTPIPEPTPTPTPSVPVIDIHNQVHDLAWLADTTGIHINTSLRKPGGNWVITGLRAVQGRRYVVQIRTGGYDRSIARSWPSAPNGWGPGGPPTDVSCPEEAREHVQLAQVRAASGVGQVDFIAGDGDVMDPAKKNGANLFWMPSAVDGSDVLRGMGILPGDVTYMPTFELVTSTPPVPEPVPGETWGSANLTRWKALCDKYATGDVTARVIGATIITESNGNPNAVSSAGAVGLMQVMPKEAGPDFKDRPTKAELLDPEMNVHWGVKILSGYQAAHGSLLRGLAAYFGGGAAGQHLDSASAVKYLPAWIKTWLTLWATDLPFGGEVDREAITAARWQAEETVRQIEAAQQQLEDGRRRLLDETIARLYELEK